MLFEVKKMNDIKILLICHKPTKNIPESDIYLPLEVGASLRDEHFLDNLDNTGDNISNKNPSYCELTGLYWAFKNLDYDVLGLVHYRRLFMKSNLCVRKDIKNVLTEKEINKLLSAYDMILPKKRHYYIETNYSHYIHAHNKEALDKTGEIIERFYPEYHSYFQKHMKKRTGHYFNMFIAKKEIINPLLTWMFDILFRLEKEIDLNDYQGIERRVFGYISELLFDVYISKNNLKIKNQKYLFFEKQNWAKKIFDFVKRKFKK